MTWNNNSNLWQANIMCWVKKGKEYLQIHGGLGEKNLNTLQFI